MLPWLLLGIFVLILAGLVVAAVRSKPWRP
jgi:hypothetical protein